MTFVMMKLQYPVNVRGGRGSCHPNSIHARTLQRWPWKLSCIKAPHLSICSSQQHDEQFVSPFPWVNQSVAAIIFGDGSESRLYPLTKRRSEGAIPIAANYRLIDVVVSNCINSNIKKIYAFTQFNSTSLNSHLSRAYSAVGLGKDGFVEVIAAYQSPDDNGWFQGNADAVRRCLWVLEEHPVYEFLILPGHHLYKMDFQRLIRTHRNNNADITIVVSNNAAKNREGGNFGTLTVNHNHGVMKFQSKSEKADEAETFGETSLGTFASMGIYLINRDIMVKLLKERFPDENEFGAELIQGAISIGMKVQAYLFDGYWEDMRSIGAFYRANVAKTKKSNVEFIFFDGDSPVYTLPRCLPPSIVGDCVITDSVIGDGCILNRCRIKGTVVGMRTRVEEGAVIEDSVIMGSDTYEIAATNMKGISIPMGVGENTLIRKAIVDKNARIGKNVMILNRDNVLEGDNECEGYVIRDGVVVVLQSAVIPDGSIL